MDNVKIIAEHIRKLPLDFWGEVKIRFKSGKATLITEEKTTRLDEGDNKKG